MHAPPAPSALEPDDLAPFAEQLIQHRHHVRFKDLAAPGPNAEQLRQILGAAASAPDHRQLRPWRFIVLGHGLRPALGRWFAQALRERDPSADAHAQAQASAKAALGACLVLAVADLRTPDPDVNEHEKWLSLGCAVQNVLLTATAMGFGTGLGGGRALGSRALRDGLGLQAGEHAACFLAFGTPLAAPKAPPRPLPDDYIEWRDAPTASG